MATFQLPGIKRFDTQMELHTETKSTDVSLAQEFQKYLPNESRKHGSIYHGKHKKGQVKKSGQTQSIMCNIIKLSSTRE